jgi:hypothetical protein
VLSQSVNREAVGVAVKSNPPARSLGPKIGDLGGNNATLLSRAAIGCSGSHAPADLSSLRGRSVARSPMGFGEPIMDLNG